MYSFVIEVVHYRLMMFPHISVYLYMYTCRCTMGIQQLFSISTHRDNTLSYTVTYRDNTLSLSLKFWLPALNPTKMYIFRHLFLSCPAFSVRHATATNTTTEISPNPKRDNQPTWEKTHAFLHTLLYFYISIPYMKYLVYIHFIVNVTPSIFSLFR